MPEKRYGLALLSVILLSLIPVIGWGIAVFIIWKVWFTKPPARPDSAPEGEGSSMLGALVAGVIGTGISGVIASGRQLSFTEVPQKKQPIKFATTLVSSVTAVAVGIILWLLKAIGDGLVGHVIDHFLSKGSS